MKLLFILIMLILGGFASASPLKNVELKKGMKRNEAENKIAAALQKTSTYNVYTMHGQKKVKYDDGENTLTVKYKVGFPAPWAKMPDGKVVHLPPTDAEVISWELTPLIINDTVLKKFLKINSQTGNEYQTMAAVEKFFAQNRQLTDQAIDALKPHLQKDTSKAWKYHIVLIKNPGFSMFGDLTVDKKTKKITQSNFMWKKYRIPAEKKDGKMDIQHACQTLLKTKLFGFGNKMGVTKPRDTDAAYKIILKDPNDNGLFLGLYDEGTIYTKLFALCALFHMDHKAYLERVAKLDKNQKIQTRNGCVVDETTIGQVINDIENSKYEYMYQRPNKLQRIDKEKAKQLFTEYLNNSKKSAKGRGKGKPAEEYDFHLRPFANSTWMVSCFWKGIHPAMDWRHLITAKGEVKEINDDVLNVLFMNEYPLSAYTKEEKEKVIKAFLNVYSGEAIDIISKTSDIPGYDKKTLDEDLAPAIRAPYVNKDGETVVYTYQKIGGVVRRFRFHWTKDQRFRQANAAKLATGIGAADYYE